MSAADAIQADEPEITEGNSFEGAPPQQALSETQFPVKKVRSLCFWKPATSTAMAPLGFACVTECSRYTREEK